jgi:hypothetical protein
MEVWLKVLVCVNQNMIGRTTVTATKPVAITKTIMTASILFRLSIRVSTLMYTSVYMAFESDDTFLNTPRHHSADDK